MLALRYELISPNDEHIAAVPRWGNADLIVRAVNAHASLLEALKEAADHLASLGQVVRTIDAPDADAIEARVGELRAAIRQAEREEP